VRPERWARARRARLALGIAAGLAAGLALWSPSASGGPTSVVPREFYGTVSQTPLTPADVDRMGRGELGTLRLFFNWSAIDSEQGGVNDWSQIDPLVEAAARNGIDVLPFVFGTPSWVVQGLDARSCQPKTCALYAPRGPAAIEEWKRFLTEAAQRYGPGGAFWAEHPELPPNPIVVWQLWNEQNSKSFYRPKPDANAYANLVTAGRTAIRAVDPTAKILLGGMYGYPGGEDNKKLLAWTFLRKLYAVPGFAEQFEGVGVHPYSARLPKVIEQVRLTRREIQRAGDGGAEMWITEVGWSSGDGKNPLERGKQGQANRLRDAMRFFIGQRSAYNIQSVTWFAWRDLAGRPICQWCAEAGLFKAKQLTPKPSWRALMSFTGGS
jgi:hypothetical protein